MQRSRAKNRILNYTAVIVGIILCVGLITVVTHADSLDKVVLLEDRNPGFYFLIQGGVYSCNQEKTENCLKITIPQSGIV